MGKGIFALILLLFLVSFSSAACPRATVSMRVPAIIGHEEKGGLLTLEVETREGEGLVYATTSPRTGISTQTSEETAVAYAFRVTGRNREECDVLFRIKGAGKSTLVDGPSAGAAMALLTIAALEDKKIRGDLTITGTIDRAGNIGAVGGLLEKARASAEAGVKVFLTPKQQICEHMLLANLRNKYNISIVEVESIAEAGEIIFGEEGTPVESRFKLISKPLPELRGISLDSDLERFERVASAVVNKTRAEIEGIEVKNEEMGEFKRFFEEEIGKQEVLLEKGYLFTGANNAFLLGIEALLIKAGEIELEKEIRETERCIEGIREKEKTRENLHWLIGADLRKGWAEKKLRETKKRARSSEERYYYYSEILFARSWCGISKMLLEEGGEGGEKVDEGALRELASETINEANDYFVEKGEIDPDSEWHLQAAKESYNKGRFGAAIYDAAYALAIERAGTELGEKRREEIEERVANLSRKKMRYLWPKIYQGQGIYLSEANSIESAYKILSFADELENRSERIENVLGETVKKGEVSKEKKEVGLGAYLPFLVIGGIIIVLFGIIVFSLFRICGKKRRR